MSSTDSLAFKFKTKKKSIYVSSKIVSPLMYPKKQSKSQIFFVNKISQKILHIFIKQFSNKKVFHIMDMLFNLIPNKLLPSQV